LARIEVPNVSIKMGDINLSAAQKRKITRWGLTVDRTCSERKKKKVQGAEGS
jgi:hypothetical protein